MRIHLWTLCVTCVCGCARAEVIDVQGPPESDSVAVTSIFEESLSAAAPIHYREVMSIDGETYALMHVPSVTTSGDVLLALDRTAGAIIARRTTGSVYQIGRTGDGPGELRRPAWMAVIADSIFVVDANGLSVFLTNGEFSRRVPIRAQPANSNFTPFPQSLAFDGKSLITSFRHPNSQNNAESIHRLDGDGNVDRPLAVVSSVLWQKLSNGMEGPPIFSGVRMFTVGQGGLIYVPHQDGQHIEVVDSTGRVTRYLHFDVRRRSVTAADIDTVLAIFEQQDRRNPGQPGIERRADAVRRQHRARYRNVVGRVLAGGPNLLLVRRDDLSPIDPASPNPAVWDLIEDSGRPRGRLLLPTRFRPHFLEESAVSGVVIDDDDVPTVIRYAW